MYVITDEKDKQADRLHPVMAVRYFGPEKVFDGGSERRSFSTDGLRMTL
jgi:hypothetical protein